MQVLTALAAQCGSPPWAAEHCRTEEALLKKAIGTLLRRVYARVRTMRLQMLRNELDYVRAAEGTCRRVTLLNLFNDKLVAPDYRCGFCDICVPDLNFDQAQATDAVGNIDLEDLVSRLNDLLAAAKPEPAALHDFICQVVDRGVLLGTLARATRHLEGDPTSLPALYLAGALSWRIPARQNQALGYFRTGFHQGHAQGLAQEILLGLFYRAGAEIDPEEAVCWLNDIGSRLAPHDFLKWVQSRELLLGCDSAAYRALSAIAKVRALGRLKGPLQELNVIAMSLSNKRSKRPRRMLPLKMRLDQ
jgi:ATP-dependent DNA helicase RecQ